MKVLGLRQSAYRGKRPRPDTSLHESHVCRGEIGHRGSGKKSGKSLRSIRQLPGPTQVRYTSGRHPSSYVVRTSRAHRRLMKQKRKIATRQTDATCDSRPAIQRSLHSPRA